MKSVPSSNPPTSLTDSKTEVSEVPTIALNYHNLPHEQSPFPQKELALWKAALVKIALLSLKIIEIAYSELALPA